jgi:hypothetical protein
MGANSCFAKFLGAKQNESEARPRRADLGRNSNRNRSRSFQGSDGITPDDRAAYYQIESGNLRAAVKKVGRQHVSTPRKILEVLGVA